MRLSYAIPVKDELVEIQKLINHLLQYKRADDEIVVLYDSNNGDRYVEEYLRSHSINDEFRWYPYKFDGHFANMKNYINSMCNGDWIVQIDADELPDKHLLKTLPDILDYNASVDLFFVPRVNVVNGLTELHVKKWGWQVNQNGWVNWPDFQGRAYRNHPDIKWTNHVHERIVGHKEYAILPTEPDYAFWHIKDIERQEKQNEYYDTL